jgi:hypothetical protein
MNLKEEKGSVLLPVLAVLLILTLIFTSVILYGAWHKMRAVKELQNLKASYLAEAGVNRAIWYLSGHEGKDIAWRTDSLTYRVKDSESYKFSISSSGGYLAVESEGKAGSTRKKVKALIGQMPSEYFSRAINLGKPDYPLVVTGNNQIIGDVMVGPAGVMEGKFKGIGFYGNTPVQGRILTQKEERLPFFSDGIIVEFESLLEKYSKNLDQRIDKALTLDDQSESGFFKNKSTQVDGNLVITSTKEKNFEGPGYVFCKGRVEISGNVLLDEGLILVADKSVEISEKAQVKDCIISSKSQVILRDSCQFQGQIFSDTSIVIKDQARSLHPSAFFVKGKVVEGKIEGDITIEDNEGSEGMIIFYEDERRQRNYSLPLINNGMVQIDSRSTFAGIVFSQNYTKLEGSLLGSVSTNMFYLYFEPTTYINWLKDSLIDRTKLHRNFILPLTFADIPRLEIAEFKEIN